MSFGEYLGAGSSTTKLLLHLNGNSNDSSGNGNNGTVTGAVLTTDRFGFPNSAYQFTFNSKIRNCRLTYTGI